MLYLGISAISKIEPFNGNSKVWYESNDLISLKVSILQHHKIINYCIKQKYIIDLNFNRYFIFYKYSEFNDNNIILYTTQSRYTFKIYFYLVYDDFQCLAEMFFKISITSYLIHSYKL